MKVKVFATYREIVGSSSTDIDVPAGEPVRSALALLVRRFPRLQEELFDQDGEIRRYVNVLVNGRSIRFLSGLDTPVSDQDELALFPPIAGGQQDAQRLAQPRSQADLVLRGISLPDLTRYLNELGAREAGIGHFAGAGWKVDLQVVPVQLGALHLEEMRLAFHGAEQQVNEVIAVLRRKTMRGGG